jgi:hypothetical protein
LGYQRKDIVQVTEAINRASSQMGVADSQLRIYGFYGLWFAHPHFYRAASQFTIAQMNNEDLYLCYGRPVQTGYLAAQGVLLCPDIRQHVSLKLISTTSVRGNTLYIYGKHD